MHTRDWVKERKGGVSTTQGDDEIDEINQVPVKVLKSISYSENFVTLKHEIGHIFGLDHSDYRNNIMYDDPYSTQVRNMEINKCVLGMALSNNGLDTYGLDDEC